MTGPSKINHVRQKVTNFLSSSYHNLVIIYTIKQNVYYYCRI